MNDLMDRAEGLRAWAQGMTTLAAAAELLIRCGPPLLTGPWVEHDPDRGRYWFNTEAVEHGGSLSGGERRLLDLAASLASDEHTVVLGDVVTGLDRAHVALVLAAIAHAAGTHEDSRPQIEPGEDGGLRLVGHDRLGSLYPWPGQEGSRTSE